MKNKWNFNVPNVIHPTKLLTKDAWKKNWLEREQLRFKQVSRWFFMSTFIGYILHFFFVDLAVGKSPVELWLAYRFSMALFSLMMIGLSFHEGFCRSRMYKWPMIASGFLFGYFQAQTLIWHPSTPYFYGFAIPCLTAVLLRMNMIQSLTFLAAIYLVQLPALLSVEIEMYLIISAATIGLCTVAVFRASMITDVNGFISEQLKDEFQNKLNEALQITKQKELALEESNTLLLRKNLVIQTLLESSTNLPHFQNVDELLDYALDQFGELFADSGVMMVLSDRGTHRFGQAVFSNISSDVQQYLASSYRKLLDRSFLDSIRPMLFQNQEQISYQSESLFSLPMLGAADKVVGTALFVGVEMDAESMDTISLFLAIVSSCAENLALTKRLEQLAHTDKLTDTYNRNYFENEIKRQIKTNHEYPELHFSLMLIDVNGLKTVNDLYGHDEGDRLIQSVANILKSTCRKTDVVCRLGGDEFVVICPETRDASQLLVRIREKEKQENLHFRTSSGEDVDIPISMSVGVASTNETEADTVMKVADELMYADKKLYYNKFKDTAS